MNNNRTLILTTILSVLLHYYVITYYSQVQERKRKELEELRAVELIEEKLPKRINPKVAKLLAQEKAKESKAVEEEPAKLLTTATRKKIDLDIPGTEKITIEKTEEPSSLLSNEPLIDLSSASGLEGEPQFLEAKINLSSLEASGDFAGVDEVITLSGTGKSTREILEEPPAKISLTGGESGLLKDVGTGLIGGGGGGIPAGKIKLVEAPKEELEEEVASVQQLSAPKKTISLTPSREKKKTETRPLISLSGPLAKRKILKKYTPRYPAWALREGAEGTVSLKFWVSKDGHVKPNIIVLKSSGYPELDRAAINALKSWVFEPGSKEEWGILTVVFQLI